MRVEPSLAVGLGVVSVTCDGLTIEPVEGKDYNYKICLPEESTAKPEYTIYGSIIENDKYCGSSVGMSMAKEGKIIGLLHSHNEHWWSRTWHSDDTHHWHECLVDGCTITGNSQKDSYGTHVYNQENNTKCVCGKAKPSSTTFSPGQSCTRGQIVTFRYRDKK